MKVKSQYVKIFEYLHLSFNKWLQKMGISCSLKATIMGTLLTWQWFRRHHWHPPQRVITQMGVCSQSALSKHIKWKVDWKKKLGRKMCSSNRDDCKLENTFKQAWFTHLGELHKEWTEAGVSASRVTTLRHLQEKGYQSHFWNRNIVRSILPELRRKITGLLVSGPKFSFQIKVNVAFNLEIKVPESGGRVERHIIHVAWSPSMKFPQSVMIWAAMSSTGVGPLCFLKSTVNTAIYQELLEHFMLPSADKLYGNADFIFQQDLAPAHTAKGTKSWFNNHGVTVLD